MKSALLPLLIGTALASAGCNKASEAHETPPGLTALNVEQIEKLLPFMVELKKSGPMGRETITSQLADGRTLVQHVNSQAYTFKVWVDSEHHPVTPTKDGQPSTMALRPQQQTGTIEIRCIGGCVPNTSGGEPCVIHGCEPVDNACGCTPIDCPGCMSAGCLPGGSGALTGTLIMA